MYIGHHSVSMPRTIAYVLQPICLLILKTLVCEVLLFNFSFAVCITVYIVIEFRLHFGSVGIGRLCMSRCGFHHINRKPGQALYKSNRFMSSFT